MEREGGLQIVALPAAFLVIGRNTLYLPSADVFDAMEFAGNIRATQWVPADVTFFRRLAVMTSAAYGANRCTECRQMPVLSATRFFEQGPIDAIGTPLVIDEASGTELCNRKEPRPLYITLPLTSLTTGHERHYWEPGEVVTRQETFRC